MAVNFEMPTLTNKIKTNRTNKKESNPFPVIVKNKKYFLKPLKKYKKNKLKNF